MDDRSYTWHPYTYLICVGSRCLTMAATNLRPRGEQYCTGTIYPGIRHQAAASPPSCYCALSRVRTNSTLMHFVCNQQDRSQGRAHHAATSGDLNTAHHVTPRQMWALCQSGKLKLRQVLQSVLVNITY